MGNVVKKIVGDQTGGYLLVGKRQRRVIFVASADTPKPPKGAAQRNIYPITWSKKPNCPPGSFGANSA
jgi:hypothetical protein